ncbi:hypothetical protein niasHT_039367 [Heterodera trifolii]|uniref:Helitron helicase-like domain-containing protein n=1 Tax=Heterodera trifolii TaxID=157864 RepID=A0ABD2HQH8_9BILA
MLYEEGRSELRKTRGVRPGKREAPWVTENPRDDLLTVVGRLGLQKTRGVGHWRKNTPRVTKNPRGQLSKEGDASDYKKSEGPNPGKASDTNYKKFAGLRSGTKGSATDYKKSEGQPSGFNSYRPLFFPFCLPNSPNFPFPPIYSLIPNVPVLNVRLAACRSTVRRVPGSPLDADGGGSAPMFLPPPIAQFAAQENAQNYSTTGPSLHPFRPSLFVLSFLHHFPFALFFSSFHPFITPRSQLRSLLPVLPICPLNGHSRLTFSRDTEIKLLFETERQLDRRLGYNIPRANEVAAVYVPGADGEVPNAKIVIRERGKELKILNSIDPMVTPMTYPLFYPRGTLGWHPGMKQRNSNRKVTRLQYVSYTLAIREREFNPILYGGKLFQQYCVDEYVKIEGDRMDWIRYNQKKICAEAYKNVDNMLMRRAQERGLPLGRKVILPQIVTNSPRYVEKHFQDAMAVVRRFGKPDMFLTMTCNPKWEEISDNLFHEQTSSDRPDLVVRVFNLKVKAIMIEIAKKKIFGEVIAWMYPVENQGRGLPHIHLLMTLAEKDKLINGEDVEKKGISARIPDKELEAELFELVKRFMIHGHVVI